MWIAVMGLMMLAGGLVRERGQGFDDFGWRGGEQTATSDGSDSGTAVTVIAGPPMGTVGRVGERGLCLRESIATGTTHPT